MVCLLFTSLTKRCTHSSESNESNESNATTCNQPCDKACNQTLNQTSSQTLNQTLNQAQNQTYNQAHRQSHSREARNLTRNTAFWHDQLYNDRSDGHNGRPNELRESNGNKKLNAFNRIKQLNLPPIYLIASLLFCLHPIHCEAVAGLVGRADIGCSLFVLLSLHFYDNYLQCIYCGSTGSTGAKQTTEQVSNMPAELPPNKPRANRPPLSDLNGRGRSEFKERRLMQLPVYLDSTANGLPQSRPVNSECFGQTTDEGLQKGLQDAALNGNLPADKPNRSNLPTDHRSAGALIQLYLAIICATISFGWKELGVTVFVICALYHLIVHCNRLAGARSQSKRLASLNLPLSKRRRRWQTAVERSVPTAGWPEKGRRKEDKLSAPLQSKEASEFRAFVRCLHAILSNVSTTV